MKTLKVIGARVHNLKNLTVEMPREKLVVITGLSGSGKSSLAFDTIFAEGQRRYVESLSAYARQFLGRLDKPDVDAIEGLSPAISIDQKGASHNPRSTVGTVTEIYDYLRLLFARAGVPHCPICGREVTRQSAQEIVDAIRRLPEGSRILVLAPLVRGRKGTHQHILDEIRKAGFTRARVDGRVVDLETDEIALDRYKQHTIEAVVDRLVVRRYDDPQEEADFLSRLTDSVETALKFGDGYLTVHRLPGRDAPNDQGEDLAFSEHLACPEHGVSVPDLEPRLFSFNTPYGACPVCQGLGFTQEIDPTLLIPDPGLSLAEGAIAAKEWTPHAERGGYYWQTLTSVARAYGIDLHKPVRDLPQEHLDIVLYGTKGKKVPVRYRGRRSRAEWYTSFEGVIGNLERRYRETTSEHMRARIEGWMSKKPCPACGGARLRPEALAVTVAGVNIVEVTSWPVSETLRWVKQLGMRNEESRIRNEELEMRGGSSAESAQSAVLTPRQYAIARRILRELEARLGFMVDVGLEYLTLDRAANTLSGGEAQRIRLATQIGSRLTGVLYVLDEPSIGLHPRDTDRLLRTLKGLRDLGNTVLVVEHDPETILAADWVVDLGPGAGEHGGRVVVEGTPEDILAHPDSLTGAYLSGRLQVPLPEKRRPGSGHVLTIVGARQNNLKNLTVRIPLGKLVLVTGVSGSGKSSLVVETLYKALARHLNRARTQPGKHDRIEGLEHLDKVIDIDQSPIGRTPRSNPGTYTGLFDHIRQLFAQLPESKIRGYKPGRFSFNVKGGRCEACQGQGQLRIEMQFLPDVYVPCEVCHGARFNRETLQVRFKGYNIADVLDMTVEQAMEVFAAFPAMMRKLQTLADVGLGYIRIGQPAPTLSGGEAQRVKLARELSRRPTGRTLYVLDEPTVGLHAADVHKLIEVLHRLVDAGNTVVVIEHNLDLIKVADWIIDLGPEGGERGGYIVAEGTPEEICQVEASYTGRYLRAYVRENHGGKGSRAAP